jgi:Fe-S cluster biogenesis protein NfuA
MIFFTAPHSSSPSSRRSRPVAAVPHLSASMLGRTLIARGRQPRAAGSSSSLIAAFRRAMFIQTETTPNPESLKFLPGKAVLPADAGVMARDFKSFKESQASPLAKKIFQIEGVSGVFLADKYITITKKEEVDWQTLKPQLFANIMDFYATGEPVLAVGGEAEVDSLAITDDDSEVVQMIKELLEMRIRPSVQEDGGDIKFHGFNEEKGVVTLEMQGSCSGCPSSSVTLKSGIENMLMHYIPEVKEVVNIGGEKEVEDEGTLSSSGHRVDTSL